MLTDDVDPATLAPREFALLVRRASTDDLRQLMRGDRRKTVLDGVFLRMPDVFRADVARATNAVVHWRIADRTDGGEDTYEVVIAEGRCRVSPAPAHTPRLTLTIGAVDFLRMVAGLANPMLLFLRGRMRAKGDQGLAMRFPSMFDLPKD